MLVDYFSQKIPHCRTSDKHSKLSLKIAFIINCTIHKTRKTKVFQSEHFNGHYSMHGRLTQVLIDYDGFVVAYKTLIPGRCHDSMVAIYNKQFHSIVGNNLALGDPGFQSCGFVVAGYGLSHVTDDSKKVFYQISKREQQLIEHVNAFVKQCKSVNKEDSFIHSESRLLACISIAFGLYNLKRSWGYFRGN